MALLKLLLEKPKGKAEVPSDHKPGMVVSAKGARCTTCIFFKGKNLCVNKYFIKWNGSNVIPGNPNTYCSDWYEPKK